MILEHIIKYGLLFIIFINSAILYSHNKYNINNNLAEFGHYSFSSLSTKFPNIPEIFFSVTDIIYNYSKKYGLVETKYYINIYNNNFHLIKPTDLPLLYNIGIFCNFYIFETNENIYSIANIYENKCYYCVEYSKIHEHAKFGVKIYKINELGEQIEFNELFFFTDKLFSIGKSTELEDNYKFNFQYLYNKYKTLLVKIKSYKKKGVFSKEYNLLKSSYMQPPLCYLKRDIALDEGKWYYKNIYETYFCFCKGESCTNIPSYYKYVYQSCKYFFYLTILDNNKYLYPKTHYLLSDFFDENIESSEAFPVFQEMIKRDFKVHYLTMSWAIYSEYCLNTKKCSKNLEIIYGIRTINGDVLEKFLELFLRLKVVVTAEKYDSIDNLFYNIEYIQYIFLGHGVTYIKSYLYKDYLNHKRYNKILLPPSKMFINLALREGWKEENIIKIGYPKWDNYELHSTKTSSNEFRENNEKAIFMMFTWRKLKRGKSASKLYYNNIYNLLNDTKINEELYLYNVSLYFCYHHTLRDKKIIDINNNTNIRFISQNEISKLLKNSSLIITDFSSILFDAIVQRKPLILFIPDGLEPKLQDIYVKEYYETIIKIKDGDIYLGEVFFDLDRVVNKIIYYIKNNFVVEKEQIEFYKKFNLKNYGNTNRFINYIRKLI